MVEDRSSSIRQRNASSNTPTSWYWNIRVGDKIQINDSGLWYTVVGPMIMTPQQWQLRDVRQRRAAGDAIAVLDIRKASHTSVNPEFLFLVNGPGRQQERLDRRGLGRRRQQLATSVANGTTSLARMSSASGSSRPGRASIAASTTVPTSPYTIQRRPAPVANAREISLPTNVVIDLTTWGNPAVSGSARGRSPPGGAINPITGYVDILLNPNGTVVPTTIYSTPSSFGMSGAFFHFWLAERSDVASSSSIQYRQSGATRGRPAVFLPIGNISQQLRSARPPYTGPSLQGRVPHRDALHPDRPDHNATTTRSSTIR